MEKISSLQTCLDKAASTGAGDAIHVGNGEEILALVSTDGGGTANFTLKFQAAGGDVFNGASASDFEASASEDNMWTYCEAVDLLDSTSLSEISSAGADVYKLVKISVPKSVSYVNARLTAYTAGNVTVRIQSYYR